MNHKKIWLLGAPAVAPVCHMTLRATKSAGRYMARRSEGAGATEAS
jgi:hypothetical protein